MKESQSFQQELKEFDELVKVSLKKKPHLRKEMDFIFKSSLFYISFYFYSTSGSMPDLQKDSTSCGIVITEMFGKHKLEWIFKSNIFTVNDKKIKVKKKKMKIKSLNEQ